MREFDTFDDHQEPEEAIFVDCPSCQAEEHDCHVCEGEGQVQPITERNYSKEENASINL